MGIKTRVYQIDDDLAINIPSAVLPPTKKEWGWIEEEIPGEWEEMPMGEWYPVIVRAYKNRTALLLTPNIGISPAEAISRLGFDPSKRLEIRPYGYGRWIKAHLYHGYYGRTWIPKEIASRTGMRKYTNWPILIRGITMPKIIRRPILREVREVIIRHMNKVYRAEKITTDKWRWRIPKTLESYPVLLKGLSIGAYPDGECHRGRDEEAISVDFSFSKPAGRIVSEATGYAYRNMAVRNYTATVDVDYPFLCEIRATYISSTPKEYYQPDPQHHIKLKEALEITVYNILQHFFQRAKPEYKYSTMSYADHIDKIDFTTTAVKLKRKYPNIPEDEPWKTNYLNYTAEGEGIPQEPTGLEEKRFYHCMKYVRVLNESSYQEGDIDRWVYTNKEIEDIILGKQRERVMIGMKPEIEIDLNGFIWRTNP